MMSESEGPKVSDAATTEEKCENSYIDTNGADGLNDDVVVNENVVAVGSSGLPELNAVVDDQVQEQGAQIEKLDAVNGEEENGNVVWDDEFPPLGSSVEHEHGLRVCFAKSVEEHNTETKSWAAVVKKPHDRVVMKVKPEFRNFSGSSCRAITSDVSTTRRVEVSNSFDVKNDDASIILSETVEGLAPHQEPKQETIEENVSNDRMLKKETIEENVSNERMLKKKTKTHKNQTVVNKGTTEPAHGNDLVVVSEPKKSAKEDVEVTRKAEEELRNRATEAKLKEQPQLEQAEKAQMRAELRAEKEAERKEKEREKRLRRRERKKAAARDVRDTENNCGSSLEISNDVEDKDILPLMPKRPQKPRLSTKPISPPLCNRNRNMYWHWMCVGLICIVIFALYILWFGNVGLFSNVKL